VKDHESCFSASIFWERSHSTTVILYKNDRSFWHYATPRAI
jgi:hypothetical protein